MLKQELNTAKDGSKDLEKDVSEFQSKTKQMEQDYDVINNNINI